MTAALLTIGLPDANGYTTADLHAPPDDGRRYELIDGSLIVSAVRDYRPQHHRPLDRTPP